MIAEETERLAQDSRLLKLLCGYAAEGDPELWRDRAMSLDETSEEDLRRLHGELLAFDWIEQNTGLATLGADGAIAKCYRLTADGRRALRLVERIRQQERTIIDSEPANESRSPSRGGVASKTASIRPGFAEAAAPGLLTFPSRQP